MDEVDTQRCRTARRGWLRAARPLIAVAPFLSGCAFLSGSSGAAPPVITIELTVVDPATFVAQGSRDTWCAVAPDGVARPLGDKSIFLGDAGPMRAAFVEENSMLTLLASSVPPELSDDYVSAVNGTRQLEAAMTAANFKLEDTGPEFNDADNQLSLAWNAMNGYSRSECG